VQRHAARAVVVDLQPALLDDPSAARVERIERQGDAVAGEPVALLRFDHAGRLRGVVRQVGDRRVAFLAVVGLRLEGDVAAREARFHLEDFLALDVQALGERVDLALGERGAVGVLVGRVVLHRLLHRAQVEEELALRLGRRDLDHPPVLEDVLVDLGLDPVHGVADQADALVRVEALHGLHQADVAFLDQVAVRQAVAEVLARDRDDQAQVRDHEPPGRSQVAVVAQATRELGLLFLGQERDAVDRADVSVEVAERGNEGPGVAQGEGIRGDWFMARSDISSPLSVPQILALGSLEC
jgi:hypothetical protein